MFSDPVSPSPLLQNLNPEQLAAVTLPATHALILAGAGSGKTRVLTTRIAWLLQTGQVWPSGILAVTFTNKAAKEMLLRLSSMLPVNVRGMWIGTFHGLCNRFLRAHYQLANLPQSFQILDTQDQLSAIKRLCKQFNIDDERYPPKELMRFIAGCKEDGLRAKDIPTLREQGVSNADADSWAAFFAPAKTPDDVLDKLSKAVIASLNKPETREAILKLGFTLKVRDPAAFKPYHAQEIATWKQIISEAGVKPE